MPDDKDMKVLLTKWDTELIDLERAFHELIEKSRRRIYELKIKFAKVEQAEPTQVDFIEKDRQSKPDID